MLKVLLLTMLPFCLFSSYQSRADVIVAYENSKQQNDFYTSVTQLLQRYVENGQVKYKTLQKDKPELEKLARLIAAYDISRAAQAEKKAFYLNAYNVLVLYQVMQHYPVKSVMDVPGFFDKQKFKIAGEYLTLNDLENKKLRAPYKDARIHFALVCAAKSCPPLLDRAYTPENVDNQLEKQTKVALQDPVFTKLLPKQKQVQVSELFKWYETDFLAESGSIIAYINKYVVKPIPNQYKLAYYSYNWQLNEAEK